MGLALAGARQYERSFEDVVASEDVVARRYGISACLPEMPFGWALIAQGIIVRIWRRFDINDYRYIHRPMD